MEINENKNAIFQANMFYLFIGILLLTFGAFVQSKNIYVGSLITSYLVIFLTSLVYAKIKGYGIKETFKLNKISPRQGFISFFAVVFAYPVGIFINFITLLLISMLVELKVPPLPIPETPKELWISLFVIALSPGICEEFMFRGLIMSSYDRIGKKKAIVCSALLFGVFHFSLQNLVGPIFLGVIFGIMVYKTNSIYPAMIGHTVNNGISMIVSYLISNNINTIDNINVSETPMDIEMGKYFIVALIVMGVIVFALGAVALSLLKSLPEDGDGNEELNNCIDDDIKSDINDTNYDTEDSETKWKSPLYTYIPVCIVIAIYIYYNYRIFTF